MLHLNHFTLGLVSQTVKMAAKFDHCASFENDEVVDLKTPCLSSTWSNWIQLWSIEIPMFSTYILVLVYIFVAATKSRYIPKSLIFIAPYEEYFHAVFVENIQSRCLLPTLRNWSIIRAWKTPKTYFWGVLLKYKRSNTYIKRRNMRILEDIWLQITFFQNVICNVIWLTKV